VVVGGLAVVFHGHARLTADVDLVIDLSPGEAVKTIAALERLGMVPRAPVAARDFVDPEQRRVWIEEKGMTVFSMRDPRRPLVEIDLFVDPPIPFDDLASRAERRMVGAQLVLVASIVDLIAMKRIAARPKDTQDIVALEAILKRKGPAMTEREKPVGSWEEDAERKLVIGLEVDDAERLRWLEEMLVIAFAAGALPRRRDAWGKELEPDEE